MGAKHQIEPLPDGGWIATWHTHGGRMMSRRTDAAGAMRFAARHGLPLDGASPAALWANLDESSAAELAARIMSNVRFECPPADPLASDVLGPCMTWTGYRCKAGYGRMSFRMRYLRAHLAMLECCGINRPRGAHVDHLCRNRACANPDHLEVVSPHVNHDRGACGHRKRMGACGRCGSQNGRVYRNQWRCVDCTLARDRARHASRRTHGHCRAWRDFVAPEDAFRFIRAADLGDDTARRLLEEG